MDQRGGALHNLRLKLGLRANCRKAATKSVLLHWLALSGYGQSRDMKKMKISKNEAAKVSDHQRTNRVTNK